MNYHFLLESVWHPPLAFEEVATPELPPEIELQALWFSGAFGKKFRLKDYRELEIKHFGEWNLGAGPDFTQCAIEIEGKIFRGDIELDHSVNDWEAHGHATNPSFSNTILHVSFRPKMREAFIRTIEHKQVPELLIGTNLLADALNTPTKNIAIAIPGRCIQPLKNLPKPSLERLLKEAALRRTSLKSGRILRTIEAHDFDSALFSACAETLGYGGNSLAMKLIAQRAKIENLLKAPTEKESILLGVAGFLHSEIHHRAPEDTQAYLRSLWETWWKIRPKHEAAEHRNPVWKFQGIRPANHPHRRVGALSALIQEWPEFRKIAIASPFSVKAVVDFLSQIRHEFWTQHHTLTSQRSKTAISLFGKNLALELCANHLIPLAIHQERYDFKSYHKLRHASQNQKLRRCAIRLFGTLDKAKPYLSRLADQQALLQIYHDFCLDDFSACEDCPFPEQLAQWR